MTVLIIALILGLAAVAAGWICFRMAFYASRKPVDPEQIETPVGQIYDPYREDMIRWTKEARAMKKEHLTVTAFDGQTLHGDFYQYAPGAPVEIMFHGYRGTAERDLSGGVQRCFRLGRSALIVDQRCSGKSGGTVITFGIREHRDCLVWAWEAEKRFGPEVPLILTGISMGAATVLMTANKDLPGSVIGILADCGYSSPKAIMKKVIRDMGLPADLCYPFVRLGARLFGGFDPDEDSPLESVRQARVPVIFFHGEADDFVPCDMSRQMYEACPTRKRLMTVPGAGHGLSYPVAADAYLEAAGSFFHPGKS